MSVDIVIPNYNSTKLLEESLPKIAREIEKYKGLIIIVDDFSHKDEFFELESSIRQLGIKSIILLRNEGNLGFSSTVNRGVAHSIADFVCLLNSDVTPEKNFLTKALADLEASEHLFGVGLMDKSIEDGKTVLRGRGLARWDKGLLVHSRGEVDKTDTFWISGGSSIIRREVFQKLSGFDTLYDPFYWEDIDLSFRARKAGFSLKFEPKSSVIHRHSEGSIKKNFSEYDVKVIAYRNQFIFVWKNITDLNLIFSHIFWLPYHLLAALARFDLAFFKGLARATRLLPDIIKARKAQSKFYMRKDSEVVNS